MNNKDYGFGSELDDLDVSEWANENPVNDEKAPALEDVKKVAEEAGFSSREPKQERKKEPETMLSIRTKESTAKAFRDLASSQEPKWPQGYTLERALAALQRELAD